MHSRPCTQISQLHVAMMWDRVMHAKVHVPGMTAPGVHLCNQPKTDQGKQPTQYFDTVVKTKTRSMGVYYELFMDQRSLIQVCNFYQG